MNPVLQVFSFNADCIEWTHVQKWIGLCLLLLHFQAWVSISGTAWHSDIAAGIGSKRRHALIAGANINPPTRPHTDSQPETSCNWTWIIGSHNVFCPAAHTLTSLLHIVTKNCLFSPLCSVPPWVKESLSSAPPTWFLPCGTAAQPLPPWQSTSMPISSGN